MGSIEVNCKSKLRSLEMKLRRKIKNLEAQLQAQIKETAFWKKTFLTSCKKNDALRKTRTEYRIKLKIEKRSLENLKDYCEKLVSNIKINFGKVKNQSIKRVLTDCFSSKIDGRIRAPKKRMSTNIRYYSRQIKKKEISSETSVRRKKLKRSITEFYLNDSNSALAPGSNDFISKNKIKFRKRFLLDTIQNLHRKFCTETNLIVSRALFFRLKPFYVVKQKITARNTCLCKVHSNFTYMFKKLKSQNVIKENNVDEFINNNFCNILEKKCMFREHDKCKSYNLTCSNEICRNLIFYNQWVKETKTRLGSKGLNYTVPITELKKITCTVSDLIKNFNISLITFQKHVFVTNHQFKTLGTIKNNISEVEAYIVLDFSQNYICKYNEEVQAVHFGASQKQISLQTGVIYLKDKHISFVSLSECLRHEAPAVWALLTPVLKRLFVIEPDIKVVHFQSDGPTSQYKNKNNFYLFMLNCGEFQLERASWNFTSAGHGKSAADGVGGTIKNMCDTYVSNGNNVLSAGDMLKVIKLKSSTIEVFIVTEQQITENEKKIPKGIPTIAQTLKIHQVLWSKRRANELSCRYLSCSDCIEIFECMHYHIASVNYAKKSKTTDNDSETTNLETNFKSVNTFEVGEWIVVIYDDDWFPGLIKAIEDGTLITEFLSRDKAGFCFAQPPHAEDAQKIIPQQVLCKIQSPTTKVFRKKKFTKLVKVKKTLLKIK